MNINLFLTLASERLAGTPPYLCEGEAESTQREEKPRVSSLRRSREHLALVEAERIQPKRKPRESSLRLEDLYKS